MVAKLIIFNGINEQCQNIFVFLYNFLCTFATTKIQIYNSSIMIRSLIIVALGGGMGSALRFLASKFVQDNMAGIFPTPLWRSMLSAACSSAFSTDCRRAARWVATLPNSSSPPASAVASPHSPPSATRTSR